MHIQLFAFLCIFVSLTACQQVQDKALPFAADLAIVSNSDSRPGAENSSNSATDLIFQSADSGQTWQDISAGLPAGIQPGQLFAGESELFYNVGNEWYRSPLSPAPVWKKGTLPDEPNISLFQGRAGVFAWSSNYSLFQKLTGTDLWTTVFKDFQGNSMRSIFESQAGVIFVGCDRGLYKTVDHGKTWKHVYDNGWVIEMAESNGVLLCTNQGGILRSTDGGENWEVVLSEGGVGIAVEVIEGGFAAINYNTDSKSRRIRTSYDGGKTWQAIDAGLRPHDSISSIKQMGDYFFCGHPDGIFRTSDNGKTWELVIPAIGEKVFDLSVSGNVIYAVPISGGC